VIRLLACLLVFALLGACSGTETIPGDTAAFADTGYTSYAWRSDPLSQSGYSKDKMYQADPAIRDAVNEKMRELGYREADREDAEFLIEYVVAAGMNDGLLPRTSTNVTPYPSAMINRQMDGASVDNAYALGGVKDTGNLMLVFVDSADKDLLWQLRISTVIQDANQVDTKAVRRIIRDGLSALPSVSR
jgi:hypothetical protein